MPIALTSLTPTIATPGTALTITGAGIQQGAKVVYEAQGVIREDLAADLVGSDLLSTVPDVLDGLAGAVSVTVVNVDESVSNVLLLTLEATPTVETAVELCSIGAFKEATGVALSETFDDAKLRRLIKIASSQIASWCQRSFRIETYTDVLDGNNTSMLDLSRTPIVSVSELLINGISIPLNEVYVYPNWIRLKDGGDYSARLRSHSRLFPYGLRNIEVTYQAGYPVIPADISDACIEQVAHLMNTLNKQGVASETNQTTGTTYQYAQTELCAGARRIANKYRRTKVEVLG